MVCRMGIHRLSAEYGNTLSKQRKVWYNVTDTHEGEIT